MCAPSAPTPPDPFETAAAQTGTNVATALANNATQMVNQVTPNGSLTYDQTGTYSFTDPNSGAVYDLPTYTATTALSPEQQAIQDQNQAAQLSLAGTAAERADFLSGYLPGSEALTDQIDSRLYDLGAERLDPRFAEEQETLRTRLINQGLTEGSAGFDRAMSRFDEGKNDAYNQLMLTGRAQALSEVNNPINQITALLSGSQVSQPNVSAQTPGALPTTDIAGLIGQNYNQQLGVYNQEVANRNSTLGGLFGAGATLLGAPAGSIAGGFF